MTRTLLAVHLLYCAAPILAQPTAVFEGKLDRQRATLRHVRQGCGTNANSTNFQTLTPAVTTANFSGGFGCPSFDSDNLTMSWRLPTSALKSAAPVANATTVALVEPGSETVSVSIAGSAGYRDPSSESHSFYSRATLKEFTGGACSNAQKVVNENLQGAGSVDMSATAGCPLNQARFLTIVPASVVTQNNAVVSFEAALTFEGVVDLAHGNQFGQGGWRGGMYSIAVEAIYKFSAAQDFTIDHIEAVQVTQRPDNSIPLVAGKMTAARVFAKLSSGATEPVLGVPMALRGFRGGAELTGSPLMSNNGAAGIWRTPKRDGTVHTFRLPPEWTAEGTIELRAEINPGRTIEEAKFDNNTGSAQATFTTKPGLALRYLPICVQPPGQEKVCPGNIVGFLDYLIPQLFPVAESNYSYEKLRVPELVSPYAPNDGAKQDAFMNWMVRIDQWAQANGAVYDNLVSWIPQGFSGSLAGLARFRTGDGGRVTFNTYYPNNRHFSALVVAHEVGHNYDLHHTAQADSCGSRDAGTDWPYPVSLIREIGYSARFDRLYAPDPNQDIMSYCLEQWISPFHYLKLYNNGVAVPGSSALKGSVRAADPADYWVVTGTVRRTGSAGALDPLLPLRSSLPPLTGSASGTFCLLVQAGAGTAATHCFTPDFVHEATGEQKDSDSFLLRIPVVAGASRISLQRSGQEVAFRPVSANVPTVQWLSPAGAETWSDTSPRTLRWQGADSDGDALTYTLGYSADNGATWLPLAMDLAASEYVLDPSGIEGGNQMRFRVTASDGFLAGSAEVGPIGVQQRPAIAVEGSPVDLGVTTAGATDGKTIVVNNPGTGPLRIDSISSSSAKFSLQPPAFPLWIPAGGAGAVSVTYTPGVVGVDTATITVRGNATGQDPFTFMVRASGVDGKKPRVAAEPAAIGFRSTRTGSSATSGIAVMNPSLVPLSLSWRVEGAGFRLLTPAPQQPIPVGGQVRAGVAFEPTAAGTFTGNLIVTSDDPDRPTLTIPIHGDAFDPQAAPQGPRISQGGVVDAAQFQAVVSPGGIASIFGAELAAGVAEASTVPLPRLLGNVRVFFHGIDAPLFFVSPNQINFQVPFEARPGTTAQVIVQRDTTQTPAESVRVEEFAPAVFLNAATKDPIATRFPDNAVITAANPAKPGDVLIVYLTGVGGLTSVPTTGEATPASPLPAARMDATVTLGGQPVTVLYAGLSPFFIGLAQLNLQLPATLPPGAKLPLVVRFGGSTGQTVQLPVQYDAPPAPVLQVNPVSINFGDVTVGQSLQRPLTIANSGTASLSVTDVASSNTRFTASVALPLVLAPGASREVLVSFQPAGAALESATLTIRSNDPVTPQIGVALTGTGVAAPSGGAPVMAITPASLAFGDTGVGASKDLTLMIGNTGAGPLSVSSITASPAQFSVAGPANANVAAGGQQSITIRFTPAAAGLVTGVVTISSNDPARPSFTVPVTGNGVLTGPQTLVLQVDDGGFERNVTILNATEAHWVNRLTPPRYPATLKAIRIYFPSGGMVPGDTFTLLSAAHTSGAATIGTPAFRTGNGRVTTTGEFVEFAVPELSIDSGDFLVGFAAPIGQGQLPMAVDISGYQGRSFVSLNGSLFEPVHLRDAAAQGNFAIRAVVDVK